MVDPVVELLVYFERLFSLPFKSVGDAGEENVIFSLAGSIYRWEFERAGSWLFAKEGRGEAGFHFPVNFSVGNPATSNGSEAEQPLRSPNRIMPRG